MERAKLFGLLLATLAAVALLGATEARAQSGKIAGVVTDASTGETIPGVNVVIDGTSRGTATDVEGEYAIVGVRPGTYTVVASAIGYQSTRMEGVRVQTDLTTEVDFQLGEEVYEGQEVVVTAEQPLIQRDVTATTSVVSGEEIAALPVENFQDVVNLQAGVVDGHFRGGRSGEVGYWVDGLPINDVYDGGLAVSVENDMVDELQVVTGAFNAEYGQAMSGIVNVVTRDGSNEFDGSMSGFAGDYYSTSTDIFPHLDEVSPTAVRNLEGSLSGPVIKNNLFFFVNGRYFANDGHIFGRDIFRPGDVDTDASGRLDLINPEGSGDSSIVALNPYEKSSMMGKLTWRLSQKIRVSGSFIGSQESFKNNDYALFFFPQAQLDQKRWARTSYLKWTHTLSNTTFYEAGLTNNYSAYRQWAFENADDPRYRDHTIYNEFNDYAEVAGFTAGGTNNSRFRRSTNTFLAKLDLTSQVNKTNLLKVGVEARRHDLLFREQFVVVLNENGDTPEERGQFVATNGEYEYQPLEFSAYVQDKVEAGDLIINAGLRFDYFDSRGVVFEDPTDPDAVFLERRLSEATEEGESLGYTPDQFFKDASPKWQVSPRLGVAFPVTAGGVIHFSYGHFFQIPNFELLYRNPFFQLGSGGSGLIGLIGNADLKPEQTISGEIGYKQELTETSAFEVTAYYRDIRDLAGTATDPIRVQGTSARYGMISNTDFGFVRGVVLRYDQRFAGNLFAGFDYTYQVAKANASDPAQVYNAAAADQELEQQIVPTDWDQRHTINVSMSYRDPGAGLGFSLIASGGSGQPYTPAQSTKQTGVILPTTIPLNSEIKPAVYDVDLTVHKDFELFGGTALQIFTKVDNLLDRQNEYGVFGDTGRATYSLQERVDQGIFRGDPDFLERWYTRPNFFSEPRRIVVGLTYRF